ncbi:hypothetical protein [Mumia zhuanghuii]|uniref:hypothetical protein n=1 Tax=Mumia zhuanghuii TaxID=2585211 RepID=UPI003635B415
MSTTTPATSRRPWRAVRAGVAASLSVCVALLGHLAGGGAAPGGAAIAFTVVAAALLAHRLAAHRWTVRTLTALVVGVQGGVHLWCALAAPPEQGAATVSAGAMLLGHALATVATVALLRHGERALWSLTDLLVSRPVRRLAYAVRTLPARLAVDVAPAVTGAPAVRLHHLLLGAALWRRGPPARA